MVAGEPAPSPEAQTEQLFMNKNPYVSWKDEYSVGNNVLDAQHQAMFRLLNDLHEALEEGKSDKPVEALVEEAIQYAAIHFRTEERLMTESGYPNLEQHKQTHQEYVRRVDEIRRSAEADAPYVLFLFLKDWWLNHVTQMDSDYAPSLKKIPKP